MAELVQVRDLARPHETLLVADALTGQDAVNTARIFNERVGITRHRADPHGRRRPRRCRARRCGTSPASRSSSSAWARSSRRSSPSTPSGWRRASSTWATWSRWSRRPPRASTGRGREAGEEAAEGRLRPRRSALPAPADAQDGRHEGHPRQAARRPEDSKRSSPRPTSTTRSSSGRCAIIDSMTKAERRDAGADQRLAQAPDRHGLRHRRCRRSTGC